MARFNEYPSYDSPCSYHHPRPHPHLFLIWASLQGCTERGGKWAERGGGGKKGQLVLSDYARSGNVIDSHLIAARWQFVCVPAPPSLLPLYR